MSLPTISPTNALKQLYYQHGLFLFLSCFLALVPGVTQAHVKAYVSLFSTHNPELDSLEPAIKLVFGRLGEKILQDYIKTNPKLIIPDQVFTLLYHANQPQEALKLISRLFFDAAQRSYPLADSYRAIIIQSLPEILTVYKHPQYQSLRSQLIQKTATLIEIEQALSPKTAAIDTAHSLLKSTSLTEKSRKQTRLNIELEALTARIKAELAGQATATSVNFSLFVGTDPIPEHILTQDDVIALKTIIYHLSTSPAPEIHRHARHITFVLPTLDLSLT